MSEAALSPKDRIIVAVDIDDLVVAQSIVGALCDYVGAFKFGMEFWVNLLARLLYERSATRGDDVVLREAQSLFRACSKSFSRLRFAAETKQNGAGNKDSEQVLRVILQKRDREVLGDGGDEVGEKRAEIAARCSHACHVVSVFVRFDGVIRNERHTHDPCIVERCHATFWFHAHANGGGTHLLQVCFVVCTPLKVRAAHISVGIFFVKDDANVFCSC